MMNFIVVSDAASEGFDWRGRKLAGNHRRRVNVTTGVGESFSSRIGHNRKLGCRPAIIVKPDGIRLGFPVTAEQMVATDQKLRLAKCVLALKPHRRGDDPFQCQVPPFVIWSSENEFGFEESQRRYPDVRCRW
jgi:hypothetical protein